MDKYLISLAFILLLFECGWLAEDLGFIDLPGIHKSHADRQNRLGAVTFSKRDVRKRSTSSLVWEETRNDQDLFAYDSVLTLDQSAAEILLRSGTHISLHENTLVSIEPPGDNADPNGPVRLKFKRGIMRTAGGREPQSVAAGEWVIEAQPKTNVVIRSRGPDQFEVETHDGQAKIINLNNTSETQTLKSGETLEINQHQIGKATTALSVEWSEPREGQRIYTHNATGNVALRWSGSIQEVLFAEPNQEQTKVFPISELAQQASATPSGGTAMNLPLPAGDFTIRLKNQNALTFARAVSVWPAPKIYLLQPLPRQRIKAKTTVSLLWNKIDELAEYRWQIATDEDFKHIVREGRSQLNTVDVDHLPLGQYYWHVIGVDELGFEVPQYYSSPFYILTQPLDPPKLEVPLIKREDEAQNNWPGTQPSARTAFHFSLLELFFSQARADEVRASGHYAAEFRWQPVEGADSYVIEISETPEFISPVINQVVQQPSFKWKNFKLSRYYWRVAAQDSDGEQGRFSDVAPADLRTVPSGPITAGGASAPITDAAIMQKQQAEAAAKPSIDSPPTAPLQSPQPDFTAAAPAPKVRVLRDDPHVRHYSVELGGHYSYEHFLGPDFVADSAGPYLGDLRLAAGIDDQRVPVWRAELELGHLITKPKDTTALPFQGQASNYSFRFSIVNDNPFAGERNWGLTVLDEYTAFTRADLETLKIMAPVLGGGFIEWKNAYANTENSFRLATYLGQALVFEGTLAKTYIFSLSEDTLGTISLEARGSTGLAVNPGWFMQGSALIFFGVRW